MIYLGLSILFSVLAIFVAVFKKHILYAALIVFYILYYPLQGFVLLPGILLSPLTTNQYIYHQVSTRGALQASLYILISSLGLFLSTIFLGKLPDFRLKAISIELNLRLFATTFGVISTVFLFIVVGPSEFFTNSRPAAVGGATLPLIGVSTLLIPYFSSPILQAQSISRKFKLIFSLAGVCCFLLTLLLSKIHFLAYSLSGLLIYQLRHNQSFSQSSRCFVLSTKRLWRTLIFLSLVLIVAGSFLFAGSARDALNNPGSSLFGFLINDSSAIGNVFANLDAFYGTAVEGFISLAGAFTFYDQVPFYDVPTPLSFPVLLTRGVFQILPNFLKNSFNFLGDPDNVFYWYPDSIVSSSLCDLYVVAGWIGAFLFPLILYLLYSYLIRALFASSSAISFSSCIVQLGMLTVFIRGSLPVYFAYAAAYLLVWNLVGTAFAVRFAFRER